MRYSVQGCEEDAEDAAQTNRTNLDKEVFVAGERCRLLGCNCGAIFSARITHSAGAHFVLFAGSEVVLDFHTYCVVRLVQL